MLHLSIKYRAFAVHVREVQQLWVSVALVGQLGSSGAAAPFYDMAEQALFLDDELLGEIDLFHPRRRDIMAMAKIASHLNHLVHLEPVLSRECAREHWIFPSPSALMSSRESRCRSVAAVAWRASESREFMLHQPIVHRMRFQRLGDRGRKNRRPFVAEMGRDR